MQVKLFNTRLEAEHIMADQQALNAFLSTITVKSTSTQFVNGNPDYWSILVFYEKEEAEAKEEAVLRPAATHPCSMDSTAAHHGAAQQPAEVKAKEKTKVKAEAQEKTKEEKSKAEEEKETQTVEKNSDELSEEEQQIALALRTWRKDKANELQQPEFMIFPNATLHALAKGKPRSMDQLESIKGIGPAKITRYGDDLMAILNAF